MPGKKKIFIFILIVASAKLALSLFLELGNDEVYYITYARHLQWNYFDHPPFVGVILKLFSIDLLLRNELFLRSGFIFCGCISMWLMYKIGKVLYNELAGWLACLLFSASVYGCIISGFMIMPDAPMLVFWLWAYYLAILIVRSGKEFKSMHLLLFGLVAGLAMMSKISAVMLWAGMGSYILLYHRSLLSNIYLYISVVITILIAFPVTIGSLISHSDGAAYHAARIAITHPADINLNYFMQQLAGEIAYTNPLCYVLIVSGLFYVFKKNVLTKKYTRLLLCFSLPLITFVWVSSLYNKTLPHWTGPSFIILLFFAATAIAHRTQYANAKPVLLYVANGVILFLMVTVIAGARFLPVAFNQNDDKKTGRGDLLLDFSGWKQFGKDFNELYRNDIKQREMKPGAFVLSNYWFPAAHLDWYVAEPSGMTLKTAGDINAIHHYEILNKKRPALQHGQDAYFIYISNYYNPPAAELLAQFTTISQPQVIWQYRNGVPVRKFYITRLKGYKGYKL